MRAGGASKFSATRRAEVDLSFIGSGRAPFLVDHSRSVDNQVGVIEEAWLDGGKGRARVRFGKSARAAEFLARVRDGELSNISVGYEIRRLRLESEEDGVETYRATDWKPHEISLVSVPADTTVGIGRSDGDKLRQLTLAEEKTMPNEPETRPAPATTPAQPDNRGRSELNRDDVLREERERVSEIQAIGEKHNMADKAREAIKSGVTVAAFRGVVLDTLGEAAPEKMAAAAAVGLTARQAQTFSFMRVIRAMANPTDRRAQEAARFEFEVGEAAAKKAGREARGIMVPNDVLVVPQVRTDPDLRHAGDRRQPGRQGPGVGVLHRRAAQRHDDPRARRDDLQRPGRRPRHSAQVVGVLGDLDIGGRRRRHRDELHHRPCSIPAEDDRGLHGGDPQDDGAKLARHRNHGA